MRFYFLIGIFFGFLTLGGCLGFNKSESESTRDVIHENIQIAVPTAWEEVSKNDLGNLEEIVAGYKSLNVNSGFANNISIVKEKLNTTMTSLNYANNNINAAQKMPEYLKLDERSIEITGDKNEKIPTKIHIFEAKLNEIGQKRKYLQLYATKDSTGYTVTLALPVDEPQTENYVPLLSSFRFIAGQ